MQEIIVAASKLTNRTRTIVISNMALLNAFPSISPSSPSTRLTRRRYSLPERKTESYLPCLNSLKIPEDVKIEAGNLAMHPIKRSSSRGKTWRRTPYHIMLNYEPSHQAQKMFVIVPLILLWTETLVRNK